MKKYLFGALLVLTLMVVPLSSQAVTIGELQCQIYQLQSQINLLSGLPCPARPASLPASCLTNPACGVEAVPIVINSVSGPTSLNLNQMGTWTLNVTAPENVTLSYSVDWGDVVRVQDVKGVGQTATFTHSYSQAGTYTVKFVVAAKGINSFASSNLTVVVGPNVREGKPAVDSLQAPQISLLYDRGVIGGSSLTTRYNVSVSANGGDIYIPLYGFNTKIYQVAGRDSSVADVRDIVTQAPIIKIPRGEYYYIKSGQKYTFIVSKSYNASHLFSGGYYSQFSNLLYLNNPEISYEIKVLDLNSRGIKTNTVYVFGEKGPWISGASFDVSKRAIVITGERLKQITSAKIGSYDFSSPIWLANWVTRTDTKVTIQESKIWPTGSVPVSLGSSLGESNKSYIIIPPVASSTQTISQPKAVSFGPPFVNVPLSVLSVHPGERVNLVGLRLTDSVTARGLSHSLSGFSLNDSKTNLSFRIHPLESPGRYLAKINGPRNLQSNTFTIVVTPSSLPRPEINVSSSILRTQPGGRITIVGTNLTSMFDTELKKSLSNISVNATKTQVTFNVNDFQNFGDYRFAVQNDTGISNTVNIRIDPVTAPVASPQTDPHHPADNNPADYIISKDEADAHTSAWQRGTVPMSEAIRARYLYCFGGAYKYELGAVGNFAPLSTAINICNP